MLAAKVREPEACPFFEPPYTVQSCRRHHLLARLDPSAFASLPNSALARAGGSIAPHPHDQTAVTFQRPESSVPTIPRTKTVLDASAWTGLFAHLSKNDSDLSSFRLGFAEGLAHRLLEHKIKGLLLEHQFSRRPLNEHITMIGVPSHFRVRKQFAQCLYRAARLGIDRLLAAHW